MRTVSVVIPTLNEEANIANLLHALRLQDYPVGEVLVVDGGSADATRAVVALFPEATLVPGHPPVGQQRQEGLLRATGDTVFFLDADTLPDPKFVGECVRSMEKRRLIAACPWYQPHPSSPAISIAYGMLNSLFWLLQKVLASGAGSCMVVDRRFANEIGGLRGDLVYEDIEFIRRASRRGRFGMLRAKIKVSDRRFREVGVGKMMAQYLLLSVFFTFGLFKKAEIVRYRFAMYKPQDPELVVLVDDNDTPIGTAPKAEIHGPNTPLHRGFSVFVFNQRGELLLQQRSSTKKTWPLEWSNSCCGHPAPGETPEDAARRRAKVELGLDLGAVHTVLPDFRYRAEKEGIAENETCPVMVAFCDDQPVPNPLEVEDLEWVSWPEFVESLDRRPLSPWCIEEALLLEGSDLFHRLVRSPKGATTGTV